MYQLTVKAAFEYVRRAIDELVSAEEIGLLVCPDAVDLHRLVEGYMVEAAVKAYSITPTVLLEGKIGEEGKDYFFFVSADKVATISMLVPVMRILSVQCKDSEIVLTELIPEDSAEGRKQLNKYIRGTSDDPRLVLLKKWNGNHMPRMNYYTTAESADDVQFDIEFLPYPELKEGVVEIAPRVEYVALNLIVAMVLDSFNETARADAFRNKAKEFIGG